MGEIRIGVVTHFFSKPMVAAVKVEEAGFKVGDRLRFVGHSTDFFQTVNSIQVEHAPVTEGRVGDLVGLQVGDRVREHDQVFKVTEEG